VELLYPARDFDKFLPKDRLTYFIESRIAEFEDIDSNVSFQPVSWKINIGIFVKS